ncbi:putative nucleotidyltransferase [Methanonatronarchaeum thermophilum]|uniref:Putative nucleotidyltransferase n=1 Tax=Methanonatronarchaeum thermophilum TaxID=1927129 RepID=A0A1Y3GD10_9EURY|nr:nucleotidyltransferase domain-containing protein [Methanonatronarchaeum thermophilum]OUJ18203.1 putative nucleotidyltransferase [Methanonatronarchaeum thermophilum]
MKDIELRIRDFFRVGHMLFSTVRYSQGDKVEALLRYIEHKDGGRESDIDNKKYRKLSFEQSFEYLKKNKPKYIEKVSGNQRQLIPKTDIDKIYRPEKNTYSGIAQKVIELFVEIGVSRNSIGLTGSRLVGLQTPNSDIDLAVYGKKEFNKARDAIQKLIEKKKLKPFEDTDWRKAYEKRQPSLTYEEFVFHEKRKNNRAKINGIPLDLLFVRNQKELPSKDFEGTKTKTKKITGTVIDDSMNFDSPAIYKIKHPTIDYVLSYTHTYAGQAYNGEEIVARGVHQTGVKEILIVGTSRIAEGEYIKTLKD